MRWIVMFVSKDERNFVADFLVGETQEADFFIADEVGPSVCRNAGGIEYPTRQNDAQVGGKQTIQTSDGKYVKKMFQQSKKAPNFRLGFEIEPKNFVDTSHF